MKRLLMSSLLVAAGCATTSTTSTTSTTTTKADLRSRGTQADAAFRCLSWAR